MKKYKLFLIVLNLVLLLVYFNHSLVKKEELLKHGKLMLLALAPVDPRSLMQGDYMVLRYQLALDADKEHLAKRGYCVVKLVNGIAQSIRFQKDRTPLKKGEYLIEYTSPNLWSINIGAESFFFEEGQAKKYEQAKYGGVKVDENGNSLLVGLYDEKLKKIE
ncbi:GDYXXLXY domain-containing protein [Pedobacter sp. ASV28]|uniref:GDYXXLXY domain-containing protein n=1 Tax=Pedobacter sp. ASV28 TaxID=2795123 RepID=UPI0018EBCD5F|nr:GDYXXLXY domain-containing protein [Pedobacter sp. ASV28]